jgi:hypothetical protein
MFTVMPRSDPPPCWHGSARGEVMRLELRVRQLEAERDELRAEVLRLAAFCTAQERMGVP